MDNVEVDGLIRPSTSLNNIIPKVHRIRKLKMIESQLGIQLDALAPPDVVSIFLATLFLISFFGVFFKLTFILGIIISIVGFWIASKTGKNFTVKTVGDLAAQMTNKNYRKVRNSDTVNKFEIHQIISEIFHEELFVEKEKMV